MITAGVDLAAEPKGTALAVIEWGSATAVVAEVDTGIDDARIVDVAARVDKLGIDCAFGWPDDFVEFISQHARDASLPAASDEGMDRRRRLAYRATDRATRDLTGRWPLSVATDRLGVTAIRCAVILERLHAAGFGVDRAGRELIVEVYPGATLRLWGLDTRGYKTDEDRRAELLAELRDRAPWLGFGAFAEVAIASHDAFDSVIAALAARSRAVGASSVPPVGMLDQAGREGWIALPLGPLTDLDPSGGGTNPFPVERGP